MLVIQELIESYLGWRWCTRYKLSIPGGLCWQRVLQCRDIFIATSTQGQSCVFKSRDVTGIGADTSGIGKYWYWQIFKTSIGF